MKIKRNDGHQIEVRFGDNSFKTSNTVESHLLYEILQKLEEIRLGIIDVENTIEIDPNRVRM